MNKKEVMQKILALPQKQAEEWDGKGRDVTEMQKAPCNIKILKQIKRFSEHNNLRPRDYIMFSNKSSQVTRTWVYRVVNDLCQGAGIDKKIGTHTFRRSKAEHLLDGGLNLTYVSRYLRHKNLSTTMKYLDISIADIQRKVDKIKDPLDVII